ncbi:hypothetical protein [Streptomyces parvus]|uniref:hypothetical protein n=1 Tax=Streptomyces parvus TaxID=66428 RepID=UPI002101605A|nr:hypothetical protein [Streptomyces parvus]MCQ1577015.1 hypothetical protein [Streptomyces parvus]
MTTPTAHPSQTEFPQRASSSPFSSRPLPTPSRNGHHACERRGSLTKTLSPLNNEEFFKDPVASSEEISTAVADTQCKKSTRLLEIWFNTEEAIQKDMIALKKKELDGLRVHHAKKLQNAQRILKED